jgi:predicted RNA polymerase sigma factor
VATKLHDKEEPMKYMLLIQQDARAAYDRALELVHSDAERRFLEQRLAELQG